MSVLFVRALSSCLGMIVSVSCSVTQFASEKPPANTGAFQKSKRVGDLARAPRPPTYSIASFVIPLTVFDDA